MSILKDIPHNSVLATMSSPLGELLLVLSDNGLHQILWDFEDIDLSQFSSNKCSAENKALIKTVKTQLTEYFTKKRKSFDLPLAPIGTSFQLKSWKALQKIKYGKTISYKEQALILGDSKKARAVGSANGKNPLPIVIPCHRVVGHNGSLTGFSGGLDRKYFLLNLEKPTK